jgi:hypothetical protein
MNYSFTINKLFLGQGRRELKFGILFYYFFKMVFNSSIKV